jgi:Domain of unknown function (DUF4126)
MEYLATIGALTGLAFTSGLRLYSTLLALGLGVRFGVLTLPGSLADLRVLAETPVLVVLALVYCVEFVADKVPWVDSMWDLVHTFIRPVGAAFLGAAAVGDLDPLAKTLVALVCGGIAFSSHTAKAGTRVAVNHSPEPFSNVGLSLAEDGVVLGGVWLAIQHPVVALVLVAIAVGIIAWTVPKIVRAVGRRLSRLRASWTAENAGSV